MTSDKIAEIKPAKAGEMRAGARTIMTPGESLTYQNRTEFEAMFNEAFNQHKTEIILDCKAVTFIDSESLEVLLQLEKELRKRGGNLKIIGLNAVCRDILIATRLINVFLVYEDIHEAIRSGS